MPLKLVLPARELWDEQTEEFSTYDGDEVILEHSLVSISKWESKWKIPFLKTTENQKLTSEMLADYFAMMRIDSDDGSFVAYLTEPQIEQISSYISDPLTATWFSDDKRKSTSREVITSEVIYYWMVSAGVPFECENWPIQRLLVLIRVISEKNKPPEKLSQSEIMQRDYMRSKQYWSKKAGKG